MEPKALHRRAHELFPHSVRLAHGWVRAKLKLGARQPRVPIGTALLNPHAGLHAPRSAKEAGFAL